VRSEARTHPAISSDTDRGTNVPAKANATSAGPVGTLIGVGVGPGDPEMVTLQAVRTLRQADRVVAPSLATDAVGRAESIVRQVAPEITVQRLVFDMSSAAGDREASHRSAAAAIGLHLDAGERIAFVTLGDPNIYSTFSALAAAVRKVRPATVVSTVAGIAAFQDLAARAATVLLDGTESLQLVTALDGPGPVEAALEQRDQAVVVYKGGRHLPAILKALAHAGRIDGAIVGELLGLPGERIAPACDWPDQPATYLATVIVPPAGRSPG
jgi:precorrin-2/cobalt-factor-2 C20-methyltransferase